MSSIEIGQGLLLDTDCLLQLLDVLCPPFSKSSLRLSVPLLPLLGSSVDLQRVSDYNDWRTGNFAQYSGLQLRRPSTASKGQSHSEKGEQNVTYRFAASFALGGLFGRRIGRACFTVLC